MWYFFLAVLFIVTGCLQTENSSSNDAALNNSSLEFAAVQDIFLSKCTGCHVFHTQSEAQLVASGRVIPGDFDNSSIYYRCTGSSGSQGPKNMPPSGAPLTSEELQAMEDWISNISP